MKDEKKVNKTEEAKKVPGGVPLNDDELKKVTGGDLKKILDEGRATGDSNL